MGQTMVEKIVSRQVGRPVRASTSSALAIALSEAFTPSQRKGSGSHDLER